MILSGGWASEKVCRKINGPSRRNIGKWHLLHNFGPFYGSSVFPEWQKSFRRSAKLRQKFATKFNYGPSKVKKLKCVARFDLLFIASSQEQKLSPPDSSTFRQWPPASPPPACWAPAPNWAPSSSSSCFPRGLPASLPASIRPPPPPPPPPSSPSSAWRRRSAAGGLVARGPCVGGAV